MPGGDITVSECLFLRGVKIGGLWIFFFWGGGGFICR